MMIEEVRMGDEKQEGVLIPCADSMQDVEEICDDDLENVAGGMRPLVNSHLKESNNCADLRVGAE